jgi:hypothetical protein
MKRVLCLLVSVVSTPSVVTQLVKSVALLVSFAKPFAPLKPSPLRLNLVKTVLVVPPVMISI